VEKHKNIIYIILVYVIFYSIYLFTPTAIKGNDMQGLHYPYAHYLKENILDGRYPSWTERMYAGYPIYADGQAGYLNPVRILLVLLFGFVSSFKIEHFLVYFVGSIYLFKFLRKIKFDFLSSVVTHFIYYFSFFHLVKMMHPNIIYITMLLPANIYFLYEFFENKKLKYLLLHSVINALGFYYGSVNAVVYSFIAQGIFSLIYGLPNIKRIIMFWISTLVLFIILILPQFIPSFYLANAGARGEEKNFNFTEGSWTPTLTITTIYPFAFGIPDEYIGKKISEWWLLHETYYYVGITSLILGVFGFFSLKDKKLKVLIASSLWVFVMFAFLKYSPLQKLFDIPPLNIFRYWSRMWFFVSFCIALCAGNFINNPKIKITKKDMWYIIPPILFAIWLEIRNGGIYLSKVLFTHLFINKGIIQDNIFWLYFILLVGTLISAILLITKQKHIYKYILVLLLISDLTIFGQIQLKSNLMPRDRLINIELQKVLENQSGKRSVVYNNDYVANRPLYYKTWNIFGYAGPFQDVKYTKYLNDNGFESARRVLDSGITNEASNNLGISNRVNGITVENINTNDRLLLNIDTTNTRIEEGIIKFEVQNNAPIEVTTKIRNYEGWKIIIDNRKGAFTSTKEDLFLKFNLEKGIHKIQMEYIPIHFYKGLFYSLIGLITIIISLCIKSLRIHLYKLLTQ